jgi:NhaP-type Na+/H+ or K+/H+ antiporter
MLRLAAVVAVLVVYSLVSQKLERRFGGPMVFMTVGILISEPFLGWFTLESGTDLVEALFKAALALVLFIEAMSLGMHDIRDRRLPGRLLVLGMPLVMVVGLAVSLLMFGALGFWEAAVLAVLLAPTDASLGLPVISNRRVPGRIRDALVIEGGLNDGLAVPFALFAAGMAEVQMGAETAPRLIELLMIEIGVAAVAGISVGWVSAKLDAVAQRRGWVVDRWARFSLVGVAVVAFALAEGFDGSGFIAAWVAGLVFGITFGSGAERQRDFSEDEGSLLVTLSFLVFGAIAVGPVLAVLEWRILIFGLLSLAVVRPIAVALSLIGTHEKGPSILFLGWFGPRGLASLVLALILISEGVQLPRGQLVLDIVTVTVALSVYLHGLTAAPLSDRYATWADRTRAVAD